MYVILFAVRSFRCTPNELDHNNIIREVIVDCIMCVDNKITTYQYTSGPDFGKLKTVKIKLIIKTGNKSFQSYLPKFGLFFKHTL